MPCCVEGWASIMGKRGHVGLSLYICSTSAWRIPDLLESCMGLRATSVQIVAELSTPCLSTPTHRMADFCFSPYGDGFGNRLPHIILAGCVPVTIQVGQWV